MQTQPSVAKESTQESFLEAAERPNNPQSARTVTPRNMELPDEQTVEPPDHQNLEPLANPPSYLAQPPGSPNDENVAASQEFEKTRKSLSSLSAPVRGKAIINGLLTDEHIQRGDFPDGTYKYKFHDGSYYLGEWRGGVIQGEGQMVWADGDTYKGSWKKNMQEGRGVYSYRNGQVYEGEFLDDKMHGMGKYTWPDGKVYEGGWVAGLQHGRGFYTNSQGLKRYGLWQHGKRIQWLPYAVRGIKKDKMRSSQSTGPPLKKA